MARFRFTPDSSLRLQVFSLPPAAALFSLPPVAFLLPPCGRRALAAGLARWRRTPRARRLRASWASCWPCAWLRALCVGCWTRALAADVEEPGGCAPRGLVAGLALGGRTLDSYGV
ncbi:hypothetical protein GUJ93_ZPchr0008g11616 [Zizania palustris]|uniref:Uncharacterized protein n=1 Tax=Zizania palustris TaxID=103762 RepID=A0A8J5RZN4_ZIZPA|nr:hypothetical protein GUJ93_ZPchr0008g11616 [Zizania palustris]